MRNVFFYILLLLLFVILLFIIYFTISQNNCNLCKFCPGSVLSFSSVNEKASVFVPYNWTTCLFQLVLCWLVINYRTEHDLLSFL